MFSLSRAKFDTLVCSRNALLSQARHNKGFMTSTSSRIGKTTNEQVKSFGTYNRCNPWSSVDCKCFSWGHAREPYTVHVHAFPLQAWLYFGMSNLGSLVQRVVACQSMRCTILCRPTMPRSRQEGGMPRLIESRLIHHQMACGSCKEAVLEATVMLDLDCLGL